MDYRRPQHPRHGMYHPSTPYVDIQNQSDSMTYSQCHPNYNDNSPWVMWQDRTSSPEVSLKKGKCCSALLGIAVFLAILTVMGIAGLAIYMGALKLDSAQYLVFDGSLRVTSGDAYNPSLSDHSNELYKKKFQFYKMLLQTIFKNSELGAALKQNTITGFAKGSLIVFFRLILDRRKVPKPLTNLEERARIIILQEFNSLIPSLPLQNLKIDANQVYIRRHFEGTSKGPERGESENSEKNTSFQIKNGVLLKTPLHSQSPKYKSTQSEHLITSKPKKPEIGFAHGSFVISSSETPIVENISSEKPRYTTEHTSNTQTSLNAPSIQIKKTKPSLSVSSQSSHVTTTETLANRLQHSPALNALLMHKQTTQKPVESTQTNKISLDSDLITLLPYNFPYAEEPWKPVLPENFTRYPQRRPPPTTTEDYSSEGVGVVEVVLDPEDIDKVYSKSPLRIEEPTTLKIKTEFLNLHDPLEDVKSKVSSGLRRSDFSSNEKSIFGPRSSDKISSFALHIESSDSHSNKEPETSITHTNGGDIVRRLENLQDYNNKLAASKISPLSQYLPEFPIVQEFHNLDTLLRSYNIRSTPTPNDVPHYDTQNERITNDFEESSTAGLPITLLPVRSNSGIGKPLRPRPTVGSLDLSSRMHFIKLASSLTPDTEQKEIHISNKPENLSKAFKDLQAFVQDSTTSDYSITNYFDSFLATITPTDLEESYKYKNRVFETLNESSIEDITYPVDYLTDSTEIITQIVDTTNIPNFHKEKTLNTLTPLQNEEILTTTEKDFNWEVTRNVHNKTHSDLYRKPKMATQFSTIILPIKLPPDKERNFEVKGEDGLYSDTSNSSVLNKNAINAHFGSYLKLPVNIHSTNLDLNENNHSKLLGNLKDNSMEAYLEKVIYNISTETPDNTEIFTINAKGSDSTTYFPYFFAQLNDSANDTNLASNRKYEKADRNSITMDTSSLGSISNLSFPYNSFRDDWNKNITKKSNDSFKSLIESQNILQISTQLMHSGLNGNHKEEEAATKNVVPSNHYVVNKNGFSILTKVFNKIPEQLETSTVNISLKNNHSECFGNLSLQCGSGECVSALSRCNHLVDCTDGSDEKNCSCAEFLQSQFLTRKICDGVVDCWDFSDENNCDWCVPGQYVCTNSRVCVDRDRLCDGERDCPNGDDERNCVSITPDIPQANTMAYNSEGYLMIRKNGQWGKLCTENFDSLNYNFKSSWSMEDLGKAVCKALTFRKFENASIINDRVFNQSSYFELSFSKGTAEGRSARMGFSFAKTNCSKKEVIHVSCSDLECGVRPQANSQWTSKRIAGNTRHSRIVGGGNAGPGSWPWQAALYKEGEFQCGATLISDKWLLSAGHCFYHALDDYWVARLGALRRGTSLPSPYEQLQPVSRIILHPGYVDSGFINDISLLEMRNPVSFTNYVRPICLPEPTMQVKDGTLCTVVGWGQLFEVGRIFPDTLQEVQLPIISTAECRKRTLFLPLYRVTENMFCAGYDRGGRDACLGDSGGPLMCQEADGRWSLVGVTSNGYGCARANRPGVYTKVSNYVNWVNMNMANVNDSASHKRNLTCNGHRCPLGECLSPARICNGYMECSDGSDEKDCW